MSEVQLYRASVEILVWEHREFSPGKNRLLTVTNRRWGGFSCPGGKVDKKEDGTYETLIEAARRELIEETGCYPESIQEFAGGVHYDEPQDGGPPWFCMAFTADGCNAPSKQEEGTEIGWHTPKQLIESSIYPDWYRFLFKLMPGVVTS